MTSDWDINIFVLEYQPLLVFIEIIGVSVSITEMKKRPQLTVLQNEHFHETLLSHSLFDIFQKCHWTFGVFFKPDKIKVSFNRRFCLALCCLVCFSVLYCSISMISLLFTFTPNTVGGPFSPRVWFSVWSRWMLTCALVSSTVGGPSTSGASSPSCLCCSLSVPWPSTPGNLTSNSAWTSYGQCRSVSVRPCVFFLQGVSPLRWISFISSSPLEEEECLRNVENSAVECLNQMASCCFSLIYMLKLCNLTLDIRKHSHQIFKKFSFL